MHNPITWYSHKALWWKKWQMGRRSTKPFDCMYWFGSRRSHDQIREVARLGIPTPCINFDQPLWQKATGIIKIENVIVVCRLGGFHTFISLMGSIENMMAGSGLKGLLEVYAENTVPPLLSGKAYMLEHYEPTYLYKVHWSATSSSLLLKRRVSTLALWRLSTTRQLMMESQTKENKKSSRTAKLWLQYIEYVDIIKQFFFVERISNWPLHLQTVIKMANLFAATGHINYARCTGPYVQEMMNLL